MPSTPPVLDLLADATWAAAPTTPGRLADPAEASAADLAWRSAVVPGAIGAHPDAPDPDGVDWWYRTTIDVPAGPWCLQAEGLATIADVWVDDRHVAHSETMWRRHRVDVGRLAGPTTVVLRFAALAPLLGQRRPRPRWRSRLVSHQNLRWYRTSSWGRMPSLPTVPAPAGPWRPLRLLPADRSAVLDTRLIASVDASGGRVRVEATVTGPAGVATVAIGDATAPAEVSAQGTLRAELHLPEIERWWPHTHGRPALYPVELEIDGARLHLGAVGFRTIEADRSDGGFALLINGVPVFARGAVWVPPDPVGLASSPEEVRADLERLAAGGCNLVRLAGTGVYEDEAFWAACDDLGILVWSDAAFANLDYPDEAAFLDEVRAELTEVWGRAGGHPSFAVACGGSEIEQQAAMLGLPADQWTPAAQRDVLPAVVAGLGLDVPYVTSSPTGGLRPFSPDAGVAHWFGVGAYHRSLAEVRRAGVRFASECLAVAVPPADDVHAWSGVPRDAGAPWDFADVRDHYVSELLGADPAAVRAADPERALDLGRAAAIEMMTATLGEWRRGASPCAGAIILWWRDIEPGAGWGLVDVGGRPKATWWALRRLLAPVAVWLVDEGLAGMEVQVANDLDRQLTATLRVSAWGPDGGVRPPVEVAVDVVPHGAAQLDVEQLLGGFRDITWSYRFGPPSFDIVLAELLDGDGVPVSRSFALPLGAARSRLPSVGLRARAWLEEGRWWLEVTTDQFAQHVHVVVDGYEPSDDWFHLEPGGCTRLRMTATAGRERPLGEVRALNSVATALVELVDSE